MQNVTVLFDNNHYWGTALNEELTAEEIAQEAAEELAALALARQELQRERALQQTSPHAAKGRPSREAPRCSMTTGSPGTAHPSSPDTAHDTEYDGELVHGMDNQGIVQDFEAFVDTLPPGIANRLRAVFDPAAMVRDHTCMDNLLHVQILMFWCIWRKKKRVHEYELMDWVCSCTIVIYIDISMQLFSRQAHMHGVHVFCT